MKSTGFQALLRMKVILVLTGGVLLVFLASQVASFFGITRELHRLDDTTMAAVNARETANVDILNDSIYQVVRDAIGEGDMAKVGDRLRSRSNIPGLLEFSIYDAGGVIADSSHADLLGQRKQIPPEIKARLREKPARIARQTEDAFEVYQPLIAEEKCLKCHSTLKVGSLAGVTLLRFSTESVKETAARTHRAIRSVENLTVLMTFLTFLAIGAILGVLTWQVILRMVAMPLIKVTDQLGRISQEVASASKEIADSIQSVAANVTEQAASIEETSSSLEEIEGMTKRNAENAVKSKELTAEAHKVGNLGMTIVKEMGSVMEGIKELVGEMGVAMAAMKTSSDQTSKIIKTIDEIAFQTNILALNAAVEAARAGESGMGFAVVADEVRNLAHRSAQAAKETAQKIEGSIKNSEHGIQVGEKVAQCLLDVVGKTNEVDQRLKAIVERIREVDEFVAEMALASREQSLGIEQINAAVNQIDQVTQSNAANAEQSASAATALHSQTRELRNSIHELQRLLGEPRDEERPSDPNEAEEARPAQASRRSGGRIRPASESTERRRRDGRPALKG